MSHLKCSVCCDGGGQPAGGATGQQHSDVLWWIYGLWPGLSQFCSEQQKFECWMKWTGGLSGWSTCGSRRSERSLDKYETKHKTMFIFSDFFKNSSAFFSLRKSSQRIICTKYGHTAQSLIIHWSLSDGFTLMFTLGSGVEMLKKDL